ncbi:hypothetical protein [Aquibacillus kalidii]|uniref:hypothetical protein n=1 Tax=Aquibacillus kalidii TaxID=2762597 RepID=UPI001644EFD7|nr:hypothetical protein [Aquibacillus kalidii]
MQNPWLILVVRSLSLLYFLLAISIVIALINPVITMDQIMSFMKGMALACKSSSLMSSMVWQAKIGEFPGDFWDLVVLFSFMAILPIILIWGVWLRTKLEDLI